MRGWINGGLSLAGAMLLAGAAQAEELEPVAPASGGVQFLSGYSGIGRLEFYSHQDDLQDERYVTEGAMTMDFDLVSAGERWSVRSRFMLLADLGSSVTQNLPFSPKETMYEFTPYGEYQRGTWLARFGWDHVCQHLIYKDNEEPWYTVEGSNIPPDVYYNRLFVGAGRRESRPEILRQAFFQEGGIPTRVIWYFEAGGYLRSLPGVDDESLYGDNDWVGDGLADIHLLLHAADRWLLFVNSRTQVLLDTGDEFYTRERLQLEAVFDSRGFGSAVYAGWHVLDEHPRDSKEGMTELGAVFYF